MPVRIYALAKEWKMDSKVLVDICTKAGITGKGSALASLTDEELATVNAFMAKAKGARAEPARPVTRAGEPAAPTPFRREDYVGPTSAGGKVPVLPTRPVEKAPERHAPATPPPEHLEPAPPAAPAEQPIAPPAVVAELAPTAPELESPGESPGQIAPPGNEAGPTQEGVTPPVEAPAAPKRPTTPSMPMLPPLERRRERQQRDKDREQRERTGPAIRLAAMPTVAKPPRRDKKGDEPAPQKPDIKLPLDAIRASRAGGGKPLSEHLKKHEEKRRKEEAGQKGPRKSGAAAGTTPDAAALLELPGATRDRGRRGGVRPAGTPEPGEAPAIGGREQRQLKRRRTGVTRRAGDEDDDSGRPVRRASHIKRVGTNTAAPRKGRVTVNIPCSVREFCEALGVPARVVLGKMLELGMVTNIAANIEADVAELLAAELGLDVEIAKAVDLETATVTRLEETEDPPETLEPRPPVITFLGHVDHGKTSLLDSILGLNVVAGEKGGITQHIRAYQIDKDGRKISFVDTPGHEAFTEMRARGANVTDIAVLVVAADDGVMPQTEEAISHAKAAGVPIVVALNKIDLPSVNVDRTYQQLAVAELLPTEWGGDTEVVKTSATVGTGMDDLLETLLTVAELHDYKANPNRPAMGTCLETFLHEGRGVVAKMLVQRGTLRVGDIVVCGPAYGRVKAMVDTLDERKRFTEAGPSTPVHLTGLSTAPGAGDRFYVLEDIGDARQLAESRASQARQRELAGGRPHVTLENLYERLGQEDQVQTLNIIIRADVRGSIEAIRKELTKLEHPEVQIKVLQATVGGITEADVHLADASDAIVVGFNVVPDEAARVLADKRGVQVRRYDIIYQLTDDLKLALEGMLRPEKQERDLGRALVQRAYHISRVGTVAGCRVLAGTITRDARIRVIRESRIVGDYPLDSLKREKDDVREVREGMECGMKLAGFNDVKEGDILEAYKIEEVARSL
ncbi:MAG: translation initiation factor IF-2 [Planctomycetota bacterium]